MATLKPCNGEDLDLGPQYAEVNGALRAALQDLARSAGVSSRDIAEAMKLSPERLAELEKSANWSLKSLCALARASDQSPIEMLSRYHGQL